MENAETDADADAQNADGRPQYRMTYEQKVKVKEWMDFADTGRAVHLEAENSAEFKNFFFSALPTMLLSSVATLVSTIENTDFIKFLGEASQSYVLVFVNGLNTILLGISNYWKWSAKAEKHRFAAQEYDSLYERLNVYKSQMEMGQVSYDKVLQDIEGAIGEVKKQCGPPPRHLVLKYQRERFMADVERACALQMERNHITVRVGGIKKSLLFRICCCCCRKRRKEGQAVAGPVMNDSSERSVAVRMLDRKLQDMGRDNTGSDMHSFGLDFWMRFRTAVEKRDLEMALRLTDAVPASMEDVDFVSFDPNERSALHHAVVCNFWELLAHLLEKHGWQSSVWTDNQNKLAIEYVDTKDLVKSPPAHRLLIASVKSICSDQNNALVLGHAKKLEALLKRVKDLISEKMDFARLRDNEGFTLAHIAAEYDQGDLIEELMQEPYRASPFESISIPPDKRDEGMLARWKALGLKGEVSCHPDDVLSIAVFSGGSSAVSEIIKFIVRNSILDEEFGIFHPNYDDGKERGKGNKKKHSTIQKKAPAKEISKQAPRKTMNVNSKVDAKEGTEAGETFPWDLRGASSSMKNVALLEYVAREMIMSMGHQREPAFKCWTLEEVAQAKDMPLIQAVAKSLNFFYKSSNAERVQLDGLEISVAFFEHMAGKSISKDGIQKVKYFSMLHYACLFGRHKLVKALLLLDQPWNKDGFSRTPYDYCIMRLRALYSQQEAMTKKRDMDAMLLVEARNVFCIMTQVAGEPGFGHLTEGVLKREKPSKTFEDYVKKYQANGVALHWACILGDIIGLRAIITARKQEVTLKLRENRLGLTQCILKDRKKVVTAADKSSDGIAGGDPVMELSPVRLTIKYEQKDALRELLVAAMHEGLPELMDVLEDISDYLQEIENDVAPSYTDNDVAKLEDLKDFTELEGDEKFASNRIRAPTIDKETQKQSIQSIFKILFSYDEVSSDMQELMTCTTPVKAISDYSYEVAVPCDFFTVGAKDFGKTKGRYYYEVEFDEETTIFETEESKANSSKEERERFHLEKMSLNIGWATENFAEVSKGHVGNYPISWGFNPWDHGVSIRNLKSGEQEIGCPVVRLNGTRKQVTAEKGDLVGALSAPSCGVGVCVDIASCRIAWRLFWPDGDPPQAIKSLTDWEDHVVNPSSSDGDDQPAFTKRYCYTWLCAPSRDFGVICKPSENRDQYAVPDAAWNNMGREWMEKRYKIFPAISASARRGKMEDICTVHLSGEFCVTPPDGFLPAVSETRHNADGQSSLPLLPLQSVYGNTSSQITGHFESFSMIHLCVLAGRPDLAAKLVQGYDVPYVPMLDVSPQNFQSALLSKPTCQADSYSLPFQVCNRAGGKNSKGFQKLKEAHEKYERERVKRWIEQASNERGKSAAEMLDDEGDEVNNERDDPDEGSTTASAPTSGSGKPAQKAKAKALRKKRSVINKQNSTTYGY